MTLRLHLLGPVQISRDGKTVHIPGHKPLALLAYLLVTGQAHSRQHLIDLLFDGPGDPKAALRWTLSKLRTAIGSDQILADRQEIAFDFDSDYWLDVTAFEAGQTELYQGDFLEGIAVRDAPGFEGWLFFERERLRDRYQAALTQQLEAAENSNDDRTVVEIGHRLLRLDNLREEWHRAVMRAYARLGKRDAALAQFERCQQILSDELGVEPAEETKVLYQQILEGDLGRGAGEQKRKVDLDPISPTLPAFLTSTAPRPSPPALFVARERELAQLGEHLETALDGHGRVLFITGEAGRGKSALLAEFARRAQGTQAGLIVASGNCNAYSSLGDPYLPFRDLLGMLGGDVESRWVAGTITTENARRIWSLMPHTVQALIDHGQNLVDLFVSGPALVKRAETSAPAGASWWGPFKTLVERGQTLPGNLEQGQLFEQYTQVLHALAARQPLVLLLDDLQWADSASVSLLFHLGRRLTGSRILIVGAYRGSDVVLDRPAAGAESQRHPLEPVINEFKRLFGQIEINLGKTPPAEDRAFVDALLDSQPNQLGETFRAALFHQGKGHPLFTVELLRDMQERGALIQDEAGRWIEASALDWEALPARIEAVIEQRLGRLDEELQDILTVASVEGELFTAQVVARLQEMGERQLLKRLSRELAQRHKLVREQGEIAVGNRRLSRYQFQHVLFQQYLYDRLSPGERRLLHGEMAILLEGLYAGHTGEIAVQLARHYVEAGQGEQAIPHLLRAGDQARLAYAHEAAIDQYRQALIFLKEQGDDKRAASTLMKLGLTYHNAFEFEQSRLAYEEAFALRPEERDIGPATIPPPEDSRTLRIGGGVQPPTLDWAKFSDNNLDVLIYQLFSRLVKLTPEMELVPDLAQRWEILERGQKYIFHLRHDAFWSDGVPVTAGDFEYAWKRILAPRPATTVNDVQLLYDIKGARAFHQGEISDPGHIGVYALNDVTLVVKLEKPAGYFLYLLTHTITCPVPRHVTAVFPDNWTNADRIVTNGPFQLSEWDPDRQVRLSRNPTYHGKFTGNVTQLEFVSHKVPATVIEQYSGDKLDIVVLSLYQLDQVLHTHSKEYVAVPALAVSLVDFDVKRPPFNDPRVRRAFALATNQNRLVKEVMQNTAAPATGGLVPVGTPGHSADIGWPYDPDQARHLLAEAGYPGGENFPVVDLLIWPQVVPTGEFLVDGWREILGVNVRSEVVAWTDVFERWEREPVHLHFYGWNSDYPDPDNFLRVAFLAQIRWRNERYDQLVAEVGQVMDQQKRLSLYRQADKILIDEAAILPLYHTTLNLLVKSWVKKLPQSAAGWWHFEGVVIDPFQQPVRVQPAVAPPAAEHTLRLAWMVQDPVTLDPTRSADAFSSHVIEQLFSGLVETNAQMELVPDVAASWQVLNNGQKYIFHLRDDVYWSDGTRLTAADFEFAWKRNLDPATDSPTAKLLYDVKAAKSFHQGKISDPNQVGVHTLDDVTLAVEMEGPTGYFLQVLTHHSTYPVPRHIIERYGESWATVKNIVTNGPFEIETWQPGRLLTLSRNPRYTSPFTGNLDRIEILSVDEPSGRLEMYEANGLDALAFFDTPPPALERVRQEVPKEYFSAPGLSTLCVFFAVNRPPLDDPRVRRAFSLATDRETLANVILRAYHRPATGGFLPPGMPGHAAEIGLPYNPAQARQLLAEAGYPEGRGFPTVEWLIPQSLKTVGDYLQGQWRKNLGIELRWEAPEWTVILGELEKHPPHLYIMGWSADYADPDSFLRTGLRRQRTGWKNDTFDLLVEQQAKQELNQQERMRLYQQADKILIEEAAILPLTHRTVPWLVKPWVSKFPVSPTKWWFPKDIVIEPHQVISVV